jgi:hypothetical protein
MLAEERSNFMMRVDDAHEKRPHGAFASVIQPTY